jgi:hypothetical protein
VSPCRVTVSPFLHQPSPLIVPWRFRSSPAAGPKFNRTGRQPIRHRRWRSVPFARPRRFFTQFEFLLQVYRTIRETSLCNAADRVRVLVFWGSSIKG